MEHWRWQPTVNQTVPAAPGNASYGCDGRACDTRTKNLEAKRVQRGQVRRDTVISVVSFDHRPEPLTNFGHSLMYSFAKFRFDFFSLRAFPLAQSCAAAP